MKKFLIIVAYLLFLCVVYVAVMNSTVFLDLQLAGIQGSAEVLGTPEYVKTFNLTSYTLLVFLLGLICGICWMAQFYFEQKEKLIAYKNERIRNRDAEIENSVRVRVLKAKIETLEKALDDALNK